MNENKNTKIIKATINERHNSCSFRNNPKGYKEVLNICTKCGYLDEETDFPNLFCDKSCEGIDFHFNTLYCPLNKFKIVDLNNNVPRGDENEK